MSDTNTSTAHDADPRELMPRASDGGGVILGSRALSAPPAPLQQALRPLAKTFAADAGARVMHGTPASLPGELGAHGFGEARDDREVTRPPQQQQRIIEIPIARCS